MILEFSVANFRSIDEEQTFSLYMTGSQGGQLSNTVPIEGTPYRMLKAVGIYGANASGKSNLLWALFALKGMIRHSHHFHESEKIRFYEPCSFNAVEKKKDTRFEIEFTFPVDGRERRFVYAIAFTDECVTYERLSAYFTNRESLLFERTRGMGKDELAFGAAYKGGTRSLAYFSNQAYLSVAGQHPAAPALIRQIAAYFTRRIMDVKCEYEFRKAIDKSDERAWNLVSYIDVGVESAQLEERNVNAEDLNLPSDYPQRIKEDILNRARKRIVLKHNDNRGESIKLDLDDESEGTQKMVRLLPQVVDVIIGGGVLVVDELDRSMHPFMAEMLVKLFNDPDLNVGQAQLVFTTHNANLLSPDLLRRDQIWFAEKTTGRSVYYSLDSFDKKIVTPSSPYVKWYLEGRFGAIPSIDYAAIVSSLVGWRKESMKNAEKA